MTMQSDDTYLAPLVLQNPVDSMAGLTTTIDTEDLQKTITAYRSTQNSPGQQQDLQVHKYLDWRNRSVKLLFKDQQEQL